MARFITGDLNDRVIAPAVLCARRGFEVARFIRPLKRQPYLHAYLA